MENRLDVHRASLFRVACAWSHDRTLADDLVQETLVKALLHTDQLRDPERLRSWLFGIMANCWRDHLRALRPMTDIDALDEECFCCDETPDVAYDRGEIVNRVRAAVARLPVGQRQVVTLVDLEEFSYCGGRGNPRHPHRHGDEPPVSGPARAAGPTAATGCRAVPAPAERQMKDDVSYDRLNALVDGELDHVEAGRVFDAIQRDPGLERQVGELRLIKDLVRHAYQHDSPAGSADRPDGATNGAGWQSRRSRSSPWAWVPDGPVMRGSSATRMPTFRGSRIAPAP